MSARSLILKAFASTTQEWISARELYDIVVTTGGEYPTTYKQARLRLGLVSERRGKHYFFKLPDDQDRMYKDLKRMKGDQEFPVFLSNLKVALKRLKEDI
ncbi:hypothetical protein SEA_FRIBS8_54 [Gordonia phage Fribs8]|nr:hypothetical protein SEA_NIBBLES_53 [Gordonia phage Nibbles]WNN95782.1 hypothetical protein SEA_FRIBS8_54 [Gordonia phage Fribs8]